MDIIKDLAAGLAVLALLFLAIVLQSCGASIDNLPIDDDMKVKVAIESGCAAAATAGCFDMEETSQIFGDLKTSGRCVSVLNSLVDKSVVTDPIDVLNLTAKVFTCKKFQKALIEMKNTIPKDKIDAILGELK